MSIVRSFGAPVIDPGGKAARMHSTGETSARRRPRTVETSWWRVRYVSTCISFGTETLPSSLTAPRSLRSRSTIMRFSARVFSLVASVSRIRSILRRGGAPRSGALDRLRLDPAVAVDVQEALGRRAEDAHVAEPQEGGVRRRIAAAQLAVHRQRIDLDAAAELVGEADLVALSGGDLALACGDVVEVARALAPRRELDRRSGRAGRGGRAARAPSARAPSAPSRGGRRPRCARGRRRRCGPRGGRRRSADRTG